MSEGPAHAARLRRMLFEAWGSSEDPVLVSRAPGRVNLIGEHTDYNAGLVLPAAIGLDVSIAFRPKADRRVELHSRALGETRAFHLDDVTGSPARSAARPSRTTWLDYVAGMARALAEEGIELRGFQGVIESRLPMGAGLASSAALELASAWALMDPARAPAPSPGRLAAIARRAEEEFVGVRCGPMDQLAASLGREGHALLIDCRSLEVEPIPIPKGVAVVVCDSGVRRQLARSAYNERRAECEEGLRLLRRRLPSARSLRDVDRATFEEWKSELPSTVARRCEHVILENERVQASARALRAGDLHEIGSLFAESQASLRDLYEVSCPELDALVQAATESDGVLGARLTGAGFGGCTVNLVQTEAVDAFRREMAGRYVDRTGLSLAVHVVRTADGAGLVQA